METLQAHERQKRILVVDDEKSFLGFTESVLESAGYRVESAENAGSAFKEIKRRRYDLLVLDIELPGKMATRLSQALKKSDRFSKLPILFILDPKKLGKLEYEQEQKVTEKYIYYMRKPFTAREFLAYIRNLLNKHSENEKSISPKDSFSFRRMFWRPFAR